jgi:hypothetical protein
MMRATAPSILFSERSLRGYRSSTEQVALMLQLWRISG